MVAYRLQSESLLKVCEAVFEIASTTPGLADFQAPTFIYGEGDETVVLELVLSTDTAGCAGALRLVLGTSH